LQKTIKKTIADKTDAREGFVVVFIDRIFFTAQIKSAVFVGAMIGSLWV